MSDTFDAAIACDGLRSLVRTGIFPDLPPPVYSGLIGTGGFVDVPEVAPTDGIMHMTFGRKAFFGYVKAPGQPVYWFNSYPASEAAARPVDDPAAYARFLESLHADDPLDNARILAAVAEVDRHYPIYDMPELPRWSRGNVLLMGDAAHAVAPHSGQGASLAIEDAVVLTACLVEAADPAAAFTRFESLRRARIQRAIRIGRMTGSQKHANGWLALRLRDLMLPIFMPLGVRAQESLYAFHADRTPLVRPG